MNNTTCPTHPIDFNDDTPMPGIDPRRHQSVSQTTQLSVLRWLRRDEFMPKEPGWYHIKNLDGSKDFRYFEDGKKAMWWNSNARDGWTPNISITHWLHITELHGKPVETTPEFWNQYL